LLSLTLLVRVYAYISIAFVFLLSCSVVTPPNLVLLLGVLHHHHDHNLVPPTTSHSSWCRATTLVLRVCKLHRNKFESMHVTKSESLWHAGHRYCWTKNAKNMLLLRFLFCSSIRNWFLLILFKTRDYNNFGTNKCEQNIYFVN
jgi:hypothetical protein